MPSLSSNIEGQVKSLKLGEAWPDTKGNHINVHGGGILFHEGTYYWFGESRGVNYYHFNGVGCYSSTDLLNWTNEGIALALITDQSSLLEPGCILERPKVIYHEHHRQFVMWFHHELKGRHYEAALTGLAVSEKVTGPYRYIRSFRPHAKIWPANFTEAQKAGNPGELQLEPWSPAWIEAVENGMFVRRDFEGGQMSRDMTVYKDCDGTAWHIHSSEENGTLHIAKLTDDYQDFSGIYYRFHPAVWNEAPAVFHKDGHYYMITSGTTGWSPNPARLYRAESMVGPWELLGNPCQGDETEVKTSFHSQPTFFLSVNGQSDNVIYMGDRWHPPHLGVSPHIWLPVTWESGNPVLRWQAEWTPMVG